MNISRLNRKAQLLVKEVQRGSGGEAKDVWVEVEELWVSKPMLMSGKLPEQAQKSSGVRMYKFESHWRSTVKEYMRLRIQGEIHDLITVEEKGSRVGLEITSMVTT